MSVSDSKTITEAQSMTERYAAPKGAYRPAGKSCPQSCPCKELGLSEARAGDSMCSHARTAAVAAEGKRQLPKYFENCRELLDIDALRVGSKTTIREFFGITYEDLGLEWTIALSEFDYEPT